MAKSLVSFFWMPSAPHCPTVTELVPIEHPRESTVDEVLCMAMKSYAATHKHINDRCAHWECSIEVPLTITWNEDIYVDNLGIKPDEPDYCDFTTAYMTGTAKLDHPCPCGGQSWNTGITLNAGLDSPLGGAPSPLEPSGLLCWH